MFEILCYICLAENISFLKPGTKLERKTVSGNAIENLLLKQSIYFNLQGFRKKKYNKDDKKLQKFDTLTVFIATLSPEKMKGKIMKSGGFGNCFKMQRIQ